MPNPRVISVNIGRPKTVEWAGIGKTSIDKSQVADPVVVKKLGIDGDQVSDTRHHGGEDQAVYVFAREDLDWWTGELGREIRDGGFGENLTTSGIDVNEAEIGERWRIGTVVFEIASVRTPCNDFKSWLGEQGYDNVAWVKRFTARERPGPYLRVIEEGELQAGDEIEVIHRPGHGVTVSTTFRALNLDRSLLPKLDGISGISVKIQAKVDEFLARA